MKKPAVAVSKRRLLQVRVSEETVHAIDRLAVQTDRSRSEIVRAALRRVLEEGKEA